jgi:uncharacterized protein YbjT (DUF2867 family)
MKKNRKGDMNVAASLEAQLKSAGFQTIKAVGEKHIHASGADDFGKSHAAFLQSAGKVSAFRMEACPEPILIVFRPAVEEPAEAPAEVNEPETDN